ncbi:glycoside hydrolase family 13 protein [Mycoplasma todarodis]|uniref:Glycosyl hydrolase family 13 catalytic domain-containing protein n=1 Tax=Mycoplasma todarodis TaxID=1937191 RepID=A0A4R0XXB8_9MOLU|nr:glycoside hydrolase family 13 protein [Mycoplasma todarodis]TCG11661.1 hypothetical protein C4B25_00940 [Mycoplasma todarodis]
MNKIAIFHRADGIYGYQTKDNGFHIRLRTAKDDIKKVELIYGDPFHWVQDPNSTESKHIWMQENSDVIEKYETDGEFDYYKFTMYNSNKRFKYYFKLTDRNGEEFLFGEQGVRDWTKNINGHALGFTWGYACEGKLNVPPKWWTQTDWYQVFPDRFASSEKELKFKTDGPEHLEVLGGNIKGITEKIGYIKDLGFKGLYINPVFKATSAHKYDTIDYLEIDSQFGTIEDFKELIRVCHVNEMKIMIDGVFNHSGYEFEPWVDVVKNGANSKYKDWFWVKDFNNLKNAMDYDFGEFQKNKAYETFGDTPTMPRINWENEGVKKYFKKVIEFWTSLGIDAWRLDVADAPSFTFWRFFRNTVKNINPDCAILGEVWYDAIPFLRGDMFDTSMNYPFRTNILEAMVYKNISISDFKSVFTKQKYLYSDYINAGLFTLVGSHDVDRITSIVKDEKIIRAMFAFMFLIPGSISFYYGDEYNQIGRYDSDNRFPMDFSDHSEHKTYKLIKKLNEIRQKRNEVIQGNIRWTNIETNELRFTWEDGTEIYIDIENDIVFINNQAIL